MDNKQMKKLCIVSTTGSVVNAFMLKHIELLKYYYDVTVVLGDDVKLNIDVNVQRINIERKINMLSDIKSLFQLQSFFKLHKFDIVLSMMPKSGLLSMLASYFVGVKTRIHFFTGQVWATKQGAFRKLLKIMDSITVRCSTNILIDSFSQKKFLEDEGVLTYNKGDVLNKGSISGVNTKRFCQNKQLKKDLRSQYKIPQDNIVFIYLGRITRDKGIIELSQLFLKLFKEHINISLVLMGPLEDKTLQEEISDLLTDPNVIHDFHYIDKPEEMLNIADVLALPSYREGFGTIVVEGAAMQIPTIGSNIYGLSDSIVDNETGLLHEVKNIDDMYKKYSLLANNELMIQTLGENAYQRVVTDFKDSELSKALLEYLEKKVNG